MRIAICDDEKYFVDEITKQLKTVFPAEYQIELIQCKDGLELMRYCDFHRIDAAILDISMPEMDGFEVARKLQKKDEDIALLFVSSKEELVFRSYEYHPFWFVPKSQLITLPDVLQKFVDKLIERETKTDCLKLSIHKKMVDIDVRTLLYFESNRHYLFMVATDGKQRFREKLNEVEKQLKEHQFIRCHVGYLVNCRMISEIEKNDLVLSNGTQIPISRNKMAETKHAFQAYLRSERW